MIELRPWQEEAVENMHNGCILGGDVGSGKTITSLAYAKKTEPGKRIVVITTAKKRDSGDWIDEAALLNIDADLFTVDSWNNIKNYEDVEDALFILDEQRLVGTGAWTKTFFKIVQKNRWILLSATPGDNWLDFAPVFIANGYYKNITEFRNTHVVYKRFTQFPQVDKYIGEDRLKRLRREVLVPMPMPRDTTRHISVMETEYDKDLFLKLWTKRWHVFEDRPIRDVAELFRVGRRLVGSHPSRLETVRQLLQKHPKLIVFYNYDWELEALRSLAWDVGGNLAEWNGHKHESVPDSDTWVYLVQYTAGSEGWNCVTTDAMVFYSLTYSYKQYMQAQGRIDRMNTPFKDLFYYVLMSKTVVDKAPWRALGMKKNFNAGAWRK